MNIFVLDSDPNKCAQYHCDKHVVKMILETAQLLCTALHMRGYVDVHYKPTHKNHPCSIWVRESNNNFRWLVMLGLALCDEYTYRYGKEHKCKKVIEHCCEISCDWPDQAMTPFAQAMPYELRRPDAVTAYRNYYIKDKYKIAKWDYCAPPRWWSNVIH